VSVKKSTVRLTLKPFRTAAARQSLSVLAPLPLERTGSFEGLVQLLSCGRKNGSRTDKRRFVDPAPGPVSQVR